MKFSWNMNILSFYSLIYLTFWYYPTFFRHEIFKILSIPNFLATKLLQLIFNKDKNFLHIGRVLKSNFDGTLSNQSLPVG